MPPARKLITNFGERIGALVEGLTKVNRLELVSKKAQQGENLRRLLLAVSQDIRVLLVKLRRSPAQYAHLASYEI